PAAERQLSRSVNRAAELHSPRCTSAGVAARQRHSRRPIVGLYGRIHNRSMLRSLASKLSSRPRRSLSYVLVFVVAAAAIGGPLAGSLKSSGGFAPPNSDSQVAIRMLEKASGADPTSGITLLVKTPGGASAARQRIKAIVHRLGDVPGVLGAAGPTAVSHNGREVLVTGTVRASADDHTVAKAAVAAFAHSPDVTVGGSAVANEQISSTVIKDLGFAELLAFPLLIGLSILFFRGRAA